MALSLATVGGKITAAFVNLIVAEVNKQGLTSVIPTSVAGTGVTLGAAGKVSASASTSISVNGCFTSTFDNYRIVLDISTHSSAGITEIRLRLSGTDATGASDYVTNSAITSYWPVGNYSSALADLIVVDLSGPALARVTRVQSLYSSVGTSTNRAVGQVGGDHIIATAYDGFTIIPGAGNITGTVRIYGYNNN